MCISYSGFSLNSCNFRMIICVYFCKPLNKVCVAKTITVHILTARTNAKMKCICHGFHALTSATYFVLPCYLIGSLVLDFANLAR